MPDLSDSEQYRKAAEKAAETYNRKDYENARDEFLALEKANPENEKIHETLAYIYLKLSDLKKADFHYQKLLDLMKKSNPDFSMPQSLEELVKDLEHPKELEKRFFQIMKSEEFQESVSATRTSIQLSMHLMARGHYDKAEKVLAAYKQKHMKNKS